MKLATWNVNSVKARRERLRHWLEKKTPEILCLQELKVPDEQFPYADLEALGYHAVVHGQKTYNGVAILSRREPREVTRGMGDPQLDAQARLVHAKLDDADFVCVYVPNGSRVGTDKYLYKLDWMKRLRHWLDERFDTSAPLVLCGDFNVAPDDKDVSRPEEWADSVLCHPDVREALEQIRAFGFRDVFREHNPEGGIYSWWDYRQLAFQKNLGLRLDHVFATDAWARRATNAYVDREERKGKGASDHAPVIVEWE